MELADPQTDIEKLLSDFFKWVHQKGRLNRYYGNSLSWDIYDVTDWIKGPYLKTISTGNPNKPARIVGMIEAMKAAEILISAWMQAKLIGEISLPLVATAGIYKFLTRDGLKDVNGDGS